MLACLGEPFMSRNWVGTFDRNAWSTIWDGMERTKVMLEWMTLGSFTKGHIGYHDELVALLREHHIGMLFVFRDLRDVVVSQYYHITSMDRAQFLHPGRDDYLALEDKEAIMVAIIEGLGEWPGIFDRWELYAPWLEVHGVLPLPFEFMRLHQEEAATVLVQWATMLGLYQGNVKAALLPGPLKEQVDYIMQGVAQTGNSATFRKGAVGDWREEFTPRVKEAFKANDPGWLVRLGYEVDNQW
jgi:hypothetical protein